MLDKSLFRDSDFVLGSCITEKYKLFCTDSFGRGSFGLLTKKKNGFGTSFWCIFGA